MMVSSIRQGRHPVSCPDVQSRYGECEPGNRCTRMNIQRDQGMCVSVPNAVPANQCLDMCDTSIPLDTFKTIPGHKEGTKKTVEAVRAGWDTGPFPVTCPGAQWWMFLWIPAILICCVLGCLGFWYANKFVRSRRMKYSDNRDQENFNYGQQQTPYISDDQYRAEESDYRRVEEEYRQEPEYAQEVPPQTMVEEVPQQILPDPLPAPVEPPPAVVAAAAPQIVSMSYATGPTMSSMPAQAPAVMMPQGMSHYSTSASGYPGATAYQGLTSTAYAQPSYGQPSYGQPLMAAANPMVTVPPAVASYAPGQY